jgi:FAD/FMN-containing dehydrogenase
MADPMAIADRLQAILGPSGLVPGPELAQRPAFPPYSCGSPLLVRPASTAELSAVLALCHETRTPVVVHGGRTGLVGGCTSGPGDLVVSTERLTAMAPVDVTGRTLEAGAGVTIAAAQAAAEDAGLLLAVDWGARGTATVGGGIATNAGGNQVFRYGMMREQVLGLEAVLADGTILSSMGRVIKNNAGPDPRQILIGSEGCFGVITRAVLRLRPRMPQRSTALVALQRFDCVPRLLDRLESGMDGRLTSFEAMWRGFHAPAARILARPPVDPQSPFVVLCEASGSDEAELSARMEGVLADLLGSGDISDAVIAGSERERADFWAIRDNVGVLFQLPNATLFDVSLPIAAMADYTADLEQSVRAAFGEVPFMLFGHLADQNLHIAFALPDDLASTHHRAEALVYDPLSRIPGASMSAEHGIGLLKRPWLGRTRTPEEIAIMRRLKAALDPAGILNPGLVVAQDVADGS